MKKISIVFTIIVASVLFLNSCYRDSEEGLYRFAPASCDTTNVTYSVTVSAIISANCVSCHDGTSQSDLRNYVLVSAKANDIVGRITGQSGDIMPKSGRMDACKINQIKAWVNKGAPQN